MDRLDELEVAFAAGLFEGEGCITDNHSNGVNLELTSTDLDTIQRFQAALGYGKIYGPSRGKNFKSYYKDQYRWRLSKKSEVLLVWNMLSPYLCARRIARFNFFKERLVTDYRFGPRGPYGPRKVKETNINIVQ